MSAAHHQCGKAVASHDPGPMRRRQWLAACAVWAASPSAGWAQERQDLEKVRASGLLKVALYKDNLPYSGASGAPGSSSAQMQGVEVALAHLLASELGLKAAWVPFDAGENMNDDLRHMVWRGHYLGHGPADVMLHVPVDKLLMARNRQALIFAPYAREVLVVLHALARVPQVRSGMDLQGVPLAAERGTGAASTLMGFGGGRLRDAVRLWPSGIEAAQAVLSGEVAAAHVTRAQAEAALHLSGVPAAGFGMAQLTLPGLADHGWPIGMAVKAEHTQLAAALDSALHRIRADGRLLAVFGGSGLTLVAP